MKPIYLATGLLLAGLMRANAFSVLVYENNTCTLSQVTFGFQYPDANNRPPPYSTTIIKYYSFNCTDNSNPTFTLTDGNPNYITYAQYNLTNNQISYGGRPWFNDDLGALQARLCALWNGCSSDNYLTADIQYGSEPKRSVKVRKLGPSAIVKPIILVEGFDLYNTDDLDAIQAYVTQDAGRDIANQLIAKGYTVFLVDWQSPNASIQSNAFSLLKVIQDTWSKSKKVFQMDIVGMSMGGIVARYALGYAEKHDIAHNCGLYVSFDSPHKGANIPLGVQHFADFFAGRNSDAATFRSIISSDAAKQLMIRNIWDAQGTKRNTLLQEMNQNGMPKQTFNIALSNGLINGTSQGIGDRKEAITWDIENNYGISVGARIYTSPYNNRSGDRAFYGWVDAGWFDTNPQERTITYSNEPAWDDAPGGYFAAFEILDSKLKLSLPIGWGADAFSTAQKILNYQFHCFVPTMSALDLNGYSVNSNSDLFTVFSSNANLRQYSNFDEVYYPSYSTSNERHARLTAQNVSYLVSAISNHTKYRLTAPVNLLLLN